MANPIQNPGSHDYFTLDGKPSPGIAKIKSGGSREEEWQDQRAPGYAGAFTVFRGEKLSVVTYEIKLWTPDHFRAWEQWITMLNEGKDRRPPRVYTLIDFRLLHNKISSVNYASVGPQMNPAPGEWTFEVALKENKKRKAIGGAVQAPNARTEETKAALEENGRLTVRLDQQIASLRAASRLGK